MEVKPGYKQTEVGVIPEDWEAKTLGNFVEIKSGESPSRFRFGSEGIPYFKVEQLNNNRKYLCETSYRICSGKTILRGSLIFPKRGASILLNKVRILAQDSFMDTNLMTLTLSEALSNEYLYYFLIFKELWRIADTTSIPQINNKHIIPFLISVPGTKAEQTAIASVLSDVDAFTESLEKLIEKKRVIKQGAMQELLTGKRRLPGFGKGKGYKQTEVGVIPEDWDARTIESVSDVVGGGTPQTNNRTYWCGDIDWYTPTEVGAQKYSTGSIRKITRTGLKQSSARLLPSGTILLTTRASIGDLMILTEQAATNQGFQSLIPKIGYLGEYLYYVMHMKKDLLIRNASGSTFLEISPKKLKGILIPGPSIAEQTAIATVLADMDTEIVSLESKLTKTRQLKQGMMSELLTGRIRLV